ncbi:MAG: Gfo/Idh/MocA family oxidoreductase [Clostridia bacterium]
MKELRFGVVGCGAIGKLQADVIEQIENAKLVAVCSATEKSAKELATTHSCDWHTDYAEMLEREDIDIVAICTPSGLHYEQTIQAGKAKKHVICEKPIDIEVAKAEEMTRVCKENGVTFSVIFQHRFDGSTVAVRKAIEEGHLGKLLWGSSRSILYRDANYYSTPWRGTWEYDGGGVLINQAIHTIDLLLEFFGPVKSVSAKCRRLLHHEIEAEDTAVASIEFANGCLGSIEASTACYPGIYSELSLFGEKGSVVIKNDKLVYYKLEGGNVSYLDDVLISEEELNAPKGAKIADRSHTTQFKNVVDAILAGKEPLVTGKSATNSLELIKAIYKSSDEKREIYLQKHL